MTTAVQEIAQEQGVSLVCEAQALSSALGRIYKLANGSGKYGSLPILDSVLIDATLPGDEITLTCTDLKRSASVVLPHQTTWPVYGRFCVNAKALYKALSGLRGPVILEQHEQRCTLRTDSGAFLLPSFPADEYPAIPSVESAMVALPMADLLTAFKQVAQAASRDTTRGVLQSVNIEIGTDTLTLTGSPRYR